MQIIVQPGATVTVVPSTPRTITNELDAGPLAAAAVGLAMHSWGGYLGRLKEVLIIERENVRKERIAREQREAEAKARARRADPLPAPPPPSPPQPQPQPRATPRQVAFTFKPGEIIAGEAAEGNGVLLAWNGQGELANAAIAPVASEHGIPPMTTRSAHAHLGAAVDALRHRGYVARVVRGGKAGDAKVRWKVGKGRPDGQPGDSFGTQVLEISLVNDRPVFVHGGTGSPELDAEGRHLAEEVAAEFTRTVGEELHPPGDVTAWLANTLRTEYQAIRMGGAWYVPAAHAERAEALCCAVSLAGGGWGADWMLPAIPVVTTDQLRAGIARSALAEVTALGGDLAQRRLDAVRAGRKDVGPRSCRGYLDQIDALSKRLDGFAVLTGESALLPARSDLASMERDLKQRLRDATLRGDAG